MLLGQRADEFFLRSLDNLSDSAAEHLFAVTKISIDDFRPDDIAGDGPAIGTLGDEKISVARRIGRNDKTKAALVVAIRAGDQPAGGFLLRQHHRTTGAKDNPTRVHKIAQRVLKSVVLIVGMKLKLTSQPALPLGAVLGGLEVRKNLRL